jgi:isoquinoline 1-oxidoreductase beta subunit
MAITRTDFVKLSAGFAGSLVLAFGAEGCANQSAGSGNAASGTGLAPNQWLIVHPDESVTIFVNKSEMGQGVATGLPTILADELDVPFERVVVEFAPAAAQYIEPGAKMMITGGSTSIAKMWRPLRNAGSIARAMLIEAAAKQWNVPASSLQTEAGYVVDRTSQRRASYGSLAGAAAALSVPKNVTLKRPDQFTLIGKQNKRYDTLAKVTGAAKYGIDVRVPGMKFATVLHPPVFGAKIRSFDASKAKAVKGVIDVVQLPDNIGIAVVAQSTYAAFAGARALSVTYDQGALSNVGSGDLFARYRELAGSKQGALVALQRGNVDHANGKTLELQYETPLVAHAAMEPMNATASVTAGGVEIWAPTQVQTLAQASAAKIAGVPVEKVTVHTTYLGGGFGRRLNHDYTDEAVAVSKAIGGPVQVIWAREEDVQHDWYKPMSVNAVRGVLDANGDLVAVEHTVVMDSIIAGLFHRPLPNGIDRVALDTVVNSPYAFPNYRVNYINPKTGVPTGSLRAPGANANAFVVESFMDEAAHAAGKDPVEFRVKLLANEPRAVNVIRTVVARAGKPAPGTAHGLGYGAWNGTHCATVAEVSVSGNTVNVHRVWVVADCGIVVNPTIVEQQMEGATNYGLSMALMSEITLKNGAVEQHNFYDFNVLRLKQAPKIDVYAIKSNADPTGIGEPATITIAPAVANAIFALTGKRLRRLPFSDALA